jgi:L-fuconolactonase
MRIDSHQHFWRYSPAEYGWMQPDWPIRRDYLPSDLEPELRACQLDGCVAVQARQSLEETRWLLELADRSPIIRGVVGWVDLCSPRVEEELARFASHPKLVGVRHVVQDEPDDRFMLRPDFRRGIAKLRAFDLTYDILVYPKQLPATIELVREFPEQTFVLDHLAKPFIKDGVVSPWREQLRELAACPNVMCKVSGLVTEARWHAWKPADFRPYLEIALEAFGPDRLMYGSDWPVALLASSYADVYALARDFVAQAIPSAEAQIFGLNATRFYGLTM